MTKAIVDQLIQNMKKAGIVTKATPWMVEGFDTNSNRESSTMHVRYIGIKTEAWEDIFSSHNNLLLRFIIDKTTASLDYYLANKPPFVKITTAHFAKDDKWEILLGELRRKLRKDKTDYLNHTEGIGNLYVRIKNHLK